jgi:inward rectifier potassium channel
MRRTSRTERVPVGDYEFHIVGGKRPGLRDLYHGLLRVPWWAAIATIVGGYLTLNVSFAILYQAWGGIHGARSGSFADAFYFSVQTMGTIGYGAMYPETSAAHALVVAESVTGLLATALTAGLVFTRFSLTRARVVFSSRVAIGPMDGVPTVMIRIGNERRRNQIVDAHFRLTLSQTSTTAEGVTMYRSIDLELVRASAPVMTRSFTVQHRITKDSPLHGHTPESMTKAEAELSLALVGVDETSLQPVHARKLWFDRDIRWGARLADVLSETEDGNMLLDLRRFHDLVASDPVPGFPYRADDAALPPDKEGS